FGDDIACGRAGRICYRNSHYSYKSCSNYRQKDCGNSNQKDSCRIHYRSCGRKDAPIQKRRQKSLDSQSPYASGDSLTSSAKKSRENNSCHKSHYKKSEDNSWSRKNLDLGYTDYKRIHHSARHNHSFYIQRVYNSRHNILLPPDLRNIFPAMPIWYTATAYSTPSIIRLTRLTATLLEVS